MSQNCERMDQVLTVHNATSISVITCPECGFQREEVMPTNACLFFYDCTSCDARLRPLPGDCCVFCSYGTVKCPHAARNIDNQAVE